MSIWEALILGLVQGLSEFLPISSTAHIIIASHLMGISFPGLAMEVFLHLASALAVIIYFHRDLIRLATGAFQHVLGGSASPTHRSQFYVCVYLIVATVITGVLGLLVEKSFGESMKTPTVMGIALLVTAFFLVAIERFHGFGRRQETDITWLDSVVIGLGQALAVIPGISRSGSTLITALYCGLERETAVRFSFILAIPVILGSSVLAIRGFADGAFVDVSFFALLVAFVVCFFASLAGIFWLIAFLKQSRLIYFAAYCSVLGVLCLTVL